jgi:FkbM family methyltransferase
VNLRAILRTVRRQRHPVRFVIGMALLRLGLSPGLRIVEEGFSLRFFPSKMSLWLWVNHADPIEERDFFRSYLRPGDLVIDAGSNIGHLTLQASVLVGDAGHVLSIEAHPATFEFLRQNVEDNRHTNITLQNVALSDAPGCVRFSSFADDSANRVDSGGDGIEVNACRLDDLNCPPGRVALMKIDIEGYEKFALDGAPVTLARTECVYFEFCRTLSDRYGYGLPDLVQRFTQHGLHIYRVRENRLEYVPAEWGSDPNEYDNLFAIRDVNMFCGRTKIRPPA